MTTNVTEMLHSHPGPDQPAEEQLARCIRECMACAQACTVCADACLSEKSVADLGVCIRLDLDCADVCEAVARVLARRTGAAGPAVPGPAALLEVCAAVCRACGDECERHAAGHEHCRLCAEACRSCAEACEDLLASFR